MYIYIRTSHTHIPALTVIDKNHHYANRSQGPYCDVWSCLTRSWRKKIKTAYFHSFWEATTYLYILAHIFVYVCTVSLCMCLHALRQRWASSIYCSKRHNPFFCLSLRFCWEAWWVLLALFYLFPVGQAIWEGDSIVQTKIQHFEQPWKIAEKSGLFSWCHFFMADTVVCIRWLMTITFLK